MQQPWLVIRPRHLLLSLRIDRRVPLVLLVTTLTTLAVMTVNIGVGEYPIAPLDVIKTVFGLPTAKGDYAFIVNTLRLPRMLVAALVGLALGMAGAIMQGITRNPLADPGIIGITAGPSFVTPDLLRVVFGVEADVVADPRSGLPLCLPYGLSTTQADSPVVAAQPTRSINGQSVPAFAAPSAPR